MVMGWGVKVEKARLLGFSWWFLSLPGGAVLVEELEVRCCIIHLLHNQNHLFTVQTPREYIRFTIAYISVSGNIYLHFLYIRTMKTRGTYHKLPSPPYRHQHQPVPFLVPLLSLLTSALLD